MKKLALLFLVFVITFSLDAQILSEKDVPSETTKAFNTKFPNATNIKWGKDSASFEVSFLFNDMNVISVFDNNGKWESSKWEIPLQYTPKAVSDYILANFPKHKTKKLILEELVSPANPEKLYIAILSLKRQEVFLYFNLKSEFIKLEEKALSKKK